MKRLEAGMLSWRRTLPPLLLLASAVSSGDAQEQQVENVAEWSLSATPVTSIGVVDGQGEYVFSHIAGVQIIPGEGVAVADGGSSSIRVYGPDGLWRVQMGRSGQGPGEFSLLYALRLSEPDTLLAFDPIAARVTKYLSSGRLLSTCQLDRTTGTPEIFIGSYSHGEYAAAWIVQRPRGEAAVVADQMDVGRFGSDGRLLNVLTSIPGMRRSREGPIPFSGHFLATAVGDTLYITDGMNGEVRVVSPDESKHRTIRVGLPVLTTKEAERRLSAGWSDRDKARLEAALHVPGTDSIPMVSDLLADDHGRLWLKRYDPATDSHWVLRKLSGGEWFVAQRNGRLLSRVVMPRGFRPMDVPGGLVAGVRTDELDVEHVEVYRLIGH